MAQPHGAQPLCPLWGGGSQSHPSPAPAHKLQSVPWEHGSSRGVDGFGGFKLVPGSWKKENNPAETWQGTGLQPVPDGDNSPTATGTRRLAAQGEGHREDEEEEGARLSPVPQHRGGHGWQPLHPHILYPYMCCLCPKASCGHLHIPLWAPGLQLPLHGSTGAGGDASTGTSHWLPACPLHRHRDTQRDKILQRPWS